jgi:hypothetical protein
MSDRRATAHWQADLALAQYHARTPAPPPLPRLEAADVQLHLQEHGVIVHHASRMPTPRDGRQVVVAFLDGTSEQVDLAREAARRMPGVLDVVFSGYNKAVMYVVASPAHPANSGSPEPPVPR